MMKLMKCGCEELKMLWKKTLWWRMEKSRVEGRGWKVFIRKWAEELMGRFSRAVTAQNNYQQKRRDLIQF
jgi:hypothetical protein